MINAYSFSFCDVATVALPEGGLWLPDHQVLTVSDLHLGKSDRIARRSGTLLPPYETRETLARLQSLIDRLSPKQVICLGDSFDDLDAVFSLAEIDRLCLLRLQSGRDWVWIEGNHDPGPVDLGGRHLNVLNLGAISFRHIAQVDETGEVSGHYHPKCSLPRGGTRPAFLIDENRIIMPAFGAYTGGLRANHPTLRNLMAQNAIAVLTGRKALPVPLDAIT